MVALDSIVIVTLAPILEPIFKGGAQRVLRDTYGALKTISNRCVVLQPLYQSTSIDSYIVSKLDQDDKIRTEHLSKWEAASQLGQVDLTISVDNIFEGGLRSRWHVLSLSNLAYDTERNAVQSGRWDRIWVPSKFLSDELIRDFHVELERIDVVPPTIRFPSKIQHEALSALARDLQGDNIPLSRRLLFPHRSDPAKGLPEAIALIRRLTEDDERWRLIVTAPSGFDDVANHEFFSQVLEKNLDILQHLMVIPWLPYDAMNQLYSMAGCTVVTSTLPESFALAAAESICSGTPVVALEAGALSRRYSELNDIYFVDVMNSKSTANLVHEICGTRTSPETMTRLQTRYSNEVHREAVKRAVAVLQETI